MKQSERLLDVIEFEIALRTFTGAEARLFDPYFEHVGTLEHFGYTFQAIVLHITNLTRRPRYTKRDFLPFHLSVMEVPVTPRARYAVIGNGRQLYIALPGMNSIYLT